MVTVFDPKLIEEAKQFEHLDGCALCRAEAERVRTGAVTRRHRRPRWRDLKRRVKRTGS